MPKFNKILGTPWHIETIKKKENDPKRHRSKCKYYNKDTEKCSYHSTKCGGSAHCDWYISTTDVQRFWKTGDKLKHNTYGSGVIIKAGKDVSKVKFSNGKITDLNIATCIENDIIIFE